LKQSLECIGMSMYIANDINLVVHGANIRVLRGCAQDRALWMEGSLFMCKYPMMIQLKSFKTKGVFMLPVAFGYLSCPIVSCS
jgi:hypothetical protein